MARDRAVPDGGRRAAVPAGRAAVRARSPSSTSGPMSAARPAARRLVPQPRRGQPAGGRRRPRRVPSAVLPGTDVVRDRGRLGRIPLRAGRPARAGRRASRAAIDRSGRSSPRRPGSLAAFLTDRRGLYAVDAAGALSWTAIRHDPWPLQPAEAEIRRRDHGGGPWDPAAGRPAAAPFREAARRRRLVAAARPLRIPMSVGARSRLGRARVGPGAAGPARSAPTARRPVAPRGAPAARRRRRDPRGT